jgi:hypothetical protein
MSADQQFCPSCGAPAGGAAKSGVPTWLWWVLGVGCGCPILIAVIGLVAAIVLPRLVRTERVDEVVSEVDRSAMEPHERAVADIREILEALDDYALYNDDGVSRHAAGPARAGRGG